MTLQDKHQFDWGKPVSLQGPFTVIELDFSAGGNSYIYDICVRTKSHKVGHTIVHLGPYVRPAIEHSKQPAMFDDCLGLIKRFREELIKGLSYQEDNGGTMIVAFMSAFFDIDNDARRRALQAFIIAWEATCPSQSINVLAPEQARFLLEKVPPYLEYSHYCAHVSQSLDLMYPIISTP